MKDFAVKDHEPSLLPDGSWIMVWNDEFDGTELDRTKWDYRLSMMGKRHPAWTDKGVRLDGKSNAVFSILLEDGRPAAGSPEGMARLFEEERRIAGKIAAIRERIDRLRKQPPYSWLTLLEDNEAVNARRRELREQRTRFEEYIAELTVLRDKLCGGENG